MPDPTTKLELEADALEALARQLRAGRLTRADQREAGRTLGNIAASVRAIELAYNEITRDAAEDALLHNLHDGQA